MFIDFFYELRRRGLKVGAQEALSVAEALSRELHETSLDGFYEVARALCVHREQDLDAFDTAFAAYFQGVEGEAIAITDELIEWLRDLQPKRELTDEERALLERIDLAEVRRRLEERLREQKGRHDRGNKWVGTGGTSPHGRGGTHPDGITVGEGAPGGRSALARAGAHNFRALRGDLNLDVRQIELALRRLRAFLREGAPTELDLEESIDATAKNAGELEVVLRPERRPATKVLLLIDVGGSMEPHVELCERLFSAARQSTHFRRLEVRYFHNCLYGHLYPTTRLRDG
ncbi:MAG TPA: VWA domain-containing protein, partial [Polyangia bacterium]